MKKRLKRKMKFSSERGIFVGPSLTDTDNKYVRYDIYDQYGPCGLCLDLHAAINLAYHRAVRGNPKLKVYVGTHGGVWHRGGCVEVGGNDICKCQYLKVG